MINHTLNISRQTCKLLYVQFQLWLYSIFNKCWFLHQEFAGEDNSDLFLEERESAIRGAQEEKRKIQMSVPGIIGPHDMPEEMQD